VSAVTRARQQELIVPLSGPWIALRPRERLWGDPLRTCRRPRPDAWADAKETLLQTPRLYYFYQMLAANSGWKSLFPR
jgi:hypothetical protein